MASAELVGLGVLLHMTVWPTKLNRLMNEQQTKKRFFLGETNIVWIYKPGDWRIL